MRCRLPNAISVDCRGARGRPPRKVMDIVTTSSSLLDLQAHAFMVDMDKARQCLDRSPDGGLFAHDQRNRSEVGQAAAIGHAQAEFIDAGGRGGSFQQAADAGDRDAQIRAVRGNSTGSLTLRSIRTRIEPDRSGRPPHNASGRRCESDRSWPWHVPGNVPKCKISVPIGQMEPELAGINTRPKC